MSWLSSGGLDLAKLKYFKIKQIEKFELWKILLNIDVFKFSIFRTFEFESHFFNSKNKSEFCPSFLLSNFVLIRSKQNLDISLVQKILIDKVRNWIYWMRKTVLLIPPTSVLVYSYLQAEFPGILCRWARGCFSLYKNLRKNENSNSSIFLGFKIWAFIW